MTGLAEFELQLEMCAEIRIHFIFYFLPVYYNGCVQIKFPLMPWSCIGYGRSFAIQRLIVRILASTMLDEYTID